MKVVYGGLQFDASDMHTPEAVIEILAGTFPELGNGSGIYKREGDILRIYRKPSQTLESFRQQVVYENNRTTVTTLKQEVNYV